MCSELTKEAYESDAHEKLKAADAFNAMFPSLFHLKEAEKLADQIHRAAELCREAEKENAK